MAARRIGTLCALCTWLSYSPPIVHGVSSWEVDHSGATSPGDGDADESTGDPQSGVDTRPRAFVQGAVSTNGHGDEQMQETSKTSKVDKTPDAVASVADIPASTRYFLLVLTIAAVAGTLALIIYFAVRNEDETVKEQQEGEVYDPRFPPLVCSDTYQTSVEPRASEGAGLSKVPSDDLPLDAAAGNKDSEDTALAAEGDRGQEEHLLELGDTAAAASRQEIAKLTVRHSAKLLRHLRTREHPHDDPAAEGLLSRMFWLIMLTNVVLGVDHGAIPAVNEVIREYYGLGDLEVGLISALPFVTGTIMAPVSGMLLEKYSQRDVLVLSVVLNGVNVLLLSLSASYVQLLLTRAAIGATQTPLVVYNSVWTTEYAPERKRGKWLALLAVSIIVGTMIGYLAAGLLPPAVWAAPLMVQAALLVGCGIALFYVDRRYLDSHYISPKFALWRKVAALERADADRASNSTGQTVAVAGNNRGENGPSDTAALGVEKNGTAAGGAGTNHEQGQLVSSSRSRGSDSSGRERKTFTDFDLEALLNPRWSVAKMFVEEDDGEDSSDDRRGRFGDEEDDAGEVDANTAKSGSASTSVPQGSRARAASAADGAPASTAETAAARRSNGSLWEILNDTAAPWMTKKLTLVREEEIAADHADYLLEDGDHITDLLPQSRQSGAEDAETSRSSLNKASEGPEGERSSTKRKSRISESSASRGSQSFSLEKTVRKNNAARHALSPLIWCNFMYLGAIWTLGIMFFVVSGLQFLTTELFLENFNPTPRPHSPPTAGGERSSESSFLSSTAGFLLHGLEAQAGSVSELDLDVAPGDEDAAGPEAAGPGGCSSPGADDVVGNGAENQNFGREQDASERALDVANTDSFGPIAEEEQMKPATGGAMSPGSTTFAQRGVAARSEAARREPATNTKTKQPASGLKGTDSASTKQEQPAPAGGSRIMNETQTEETPSRRKTDEETWEEIRAAWKDRVVLIYAGIAISGPVAGILVGGWVVDSVGGLQGISQRVILLRWYILASALVSVVVIAAACVPAAPPPSSASGMLALLCSLMWVLLFLGAANVPGLIGLALAVVPPKLRPTASGILNAAQQVLGWALGPALAGAVMSGVSGDRKAKLHAGLGVLVVLYPMQTAVLSVVMYMRQRKESVRRAGIYADRLELLNLFFCELCLSLAESAGPDFAVEETGDEGRIKEKEGVEGDRSASAGERLALLTLDETEDRGKTLAGVRSVIEEKFARVLAEKRQQETEPTSSPPVVEHVHFHLLPVEQQKRQLRKIHAGLRDAVRQAEKLPVGQAALESALPKARRNLDKLEAYYNHPVVN